MTAILESPLFPVRAGGKLSPREVETVTLVADGLTNRQIGRRMGISENTVRANLADIGHKLGARDRAAMTATVLRLGIVRRRPYPPGTLLPRVSPLDAHVIRLVACGWTNEQIAAELGLSLWTVQGRLKWWFTWFGAANRAGAVKAAVDAGVLPVASVGLAEPQNGPQGLAGGARSRLDAEAGNGPLRPAGDRVGPSLGQGDGEDATERPAEPAAGSQTHDAAEAATGALSGLPGAVEVDR